MTSRIGTYVERVLDAPYRAYIPKDLPPNPQIDLEGLYARHEEAAIGLGQLDGMSRILPNPDQFLYIYVRQEALLSSQIEGTQSSLSDLLLYEIDEAPGVPIDDVEEVSNYVAALQYGLSQIAEGFPLSLRLIRQIHAVLLRGGRGATKVPGEFRRSQVWIRGASPRHAEFVPPPPDLLDPSLNNLEHFINTDESMPALIRAGVAHVQFETIHPFLDGNGRLGRLLITLMLAQSGLLKEPLLYLSLYLKTHRETYYRMLQRVRLDGDWEAWLDFFLEGVASVANQATNAAQAILHQFDKDRKQISALGRRAASTSQVHLAFQQRPVLDAAQIKKLCPLSAPTIRASIAELEALGILNEITGRQRDRVYMYTPYYRLLAAGAEPIKPG
jgi:Fic family protein